VNIETKFQDVIEFDESNILTFESGLPGFEKENQFILLPIEGTVFSMLQSIQTKELAFITTDPFLFFKDYDFELSASDLERLEIKGESDVCVQVILTVADPFKKSTANLQAPLIINTKNKKCKQIVLSDSFYRTKHLLTESTVRQGD
jgi:flagellar assembly factor FliW